MLLPAFCIAEVDTGTIDPDPEVVKAKLPEWQKACDQNDGFACGNIGAVYALGKGLPQNNTKALEYYEKACRFGQALRCLRAGIFVLNGIGASQSVDRAAEMFRLGCGSLDPDSCVNYYAVTHGKMVTATGETVDMPASMKSVLPDSVTLQSVMSVLTLSCTKGVAKSCGNLGGLYEDGGVGPRNLERALEYYAKACELGEADRCARAGRFSANNIGGASPIRDKAAKFFERYCELKKMETCPLAHRARNGLSIEVTIAEPKAVSVMPAPPPSSVPAPLPAPTSAAVPGTLKPVEIAVSDRKMAEPPKSTPPWARYPTNLAVQTAGMPDDVVEMVNSCNRGNARACGNAGAALVDDAGKPKMWPEATRQLFERACGLGRAQRCVDLARFHANGWGTEKSPEREKAALAEACRLGHKPSCVPVPLAK